MFGRRKNRQPLAQPTAEVDAWAGAARIVRARAPEPAPDHAGTDPHAFVAAENTCHFHPDFGMGVVGILVLTRPSTLRSPGIYVCDSSRQWVKGYELSDLPADEWARLTLPSGEPIPVEVMVVDPSRVLARFLGPGGRSVSPGDWNSGGELSAAAQAEAAERRLRLARSDDQDIMNSIRNIRA